MTFRVGQKVVCVDSTPNHKGITPPLSNGEIYKITWIGTAWKGIEFDTVGVRVAGIEDNPNWLSIFSADRFRPLVTTSIDIFTAMLVPSPKQKVDAE